MAERIGFLLGLRSVLINPNLQPQNNMMGKLDRPEEYADIATKCVIDFREKNRDKSLVILSRNDEVVDNQLVNAELCDFYRICWDEKQSHKLPVLGKRPLNYV